ncbi:hypothetical protein D7Y13_29540 [Corallococcus praedator]|uniref:Tox-REase-5 domain-containing protein n=1 Tax=Corallococcus praedator TaxID=2316724 RepID=A0ABX9QA27_9BACT|nr:hypothetical protein D7X75_35005 [Corallococcus sp. CA031C]RKH97836.1 hypothetical protein D7Y13_29540 [Corallococcus praedator]
MTFERVDLLMLCMTLLAMGCTGVETSAGRGSSRRLHQRTAYASEASGTNQRPPETEDPSSEEEEEGRSHPKRLPPGTTLLGTHPGELSRQAVELGLFEVDAFEKLLVRAGIDDLDELPVRRNPFTPDDAIEVLERLLEKPVTLGTFPPRMAAGFLLREVLEHGEVSREELLRRMRRFAREQVAVLRPDGYLAWALDGSTQQKVVPIRWKDGAFRSGHFELGRFYSGRGGVFRHVDGQLRSVDGPPLAEVYDDADVINRSLDGAEDALKELALAVGGLISRSPGDALASLQHLPTGVVALIRSSPEYLERFQYMTAGEQIREVARLTTSVIVTWGAASATTRAVKGLMVGAEATVPVLSLSAEGALALERIAVPTGSTAAVLSGGPGAAVILQRAHTVTQGATPPPDPGRWGPSNESMSARARRYQEQIAEHSADEAYWVDGVKFDGFKDDVLLEAKGPGYANKFLDDLKPRVWFEKSGAKALVEQAQRQLRAARGSGTPIRWHIAEQSTADALRRLFKDKEIYGIEVVFSPPMP